MTEKTWKKWSDAENIALLRETRKHTTLSSSFMAYAASTGRTVSSVSQHYDKIKKDVHLDGFAVSAPQDNTQEEGIIESKKGKPWSKEEDDTLLRYITAGVTNLHVCFLAVAEQTGRTPTGVAAHWYGVLSKKPDVLAFFTASKNHVARNRKNGKGVESNPSVWRRLLAVLRSLHF